MKKTAAILSIALTVLATTPTFARERNAQDVRNHQDHSWTQQRVAPGFYDPAKVPPGNVPFAPF